MKMKPKKKKKNTNNKNEIERFGLWENERESHTPGVSYGIYSHNVIQMLSTFLLCMYGWQIDTQIYISYFLQWFIGTIIWRVVFVFFFLWLWVLRHIQHIADIWFPIQFIFDWHDRVLVFTLCCSCVEQPFIKKKSVEFIINSEKWNYSGSARFKLLNILYSRLFYSSQFNCLQIPISLFPMNCNFLSEIHTNTHTNGFDSPFAWIAFAS